MAYRPSKVAPEGSFKNHPSFAKYRIKWLFLMLMLLVLQHTANLAFVAAGDFGTLLAMASKKGL